MNYLFIVNPVSGNGKGIEVAKVIDAYCSSLGIGYKIIYTNKKGNVDLSKIDRCSTIYSVGGDGTLNQVVNSMIGLKSRLCILPVGTGNDFYKSLNEFDGNKLDVGKVNDKYFINITSIGLDAEIANYANKLKEKNITGNKAYTLGIIKEFLTYKPINLDICGENKDITILTICNGKYYGGGYKIAPNAKLNSGIFDIVEVNSLNKLQIINLISKLIKVKHIGDSNVNYYNLDSLNITSPVPLNCNIDGEIIRDTNFDFSIKKEAIFLETNDQLKIKELLLRKNILK